MNSTDEQSNEEGFARDQVQVIHNEQPNKDLLNVEFSESLKKGWIKSDVKPEPEPKPDDEPERAVRKKRATNEVIKNFVRWCFDNEAFVKFTNGRIRQMYLNEKGIELTTSTINNQRKRWVMINGEIYDVNKTWLLPKNEVSK